MTNLLNKDKYKNAEKTKKQYQYSE